ncbi:hypothetical protein [Haloarchaeobius salinus]|uniref:hypothetical protein n=1 Tax=Haloarchaeobius salinus TaxID=1198298 RepID=UPI0034A3721F
MTGMKEGAGEDPFAEETPEDTGPSGSSSTGTTTGAASGESSSTESADHSSSGSSRSGGRRSMSIPYKFRRDGVQDGRDRVPLFLKPETKSAERDALRELEERFDADVSLTDLREALVMVGLEHLDEVEGELEEWGYGMTFDE